MPPRYATLLDKSPALPQILSSNFSHIPGINVLYLVDSFFKSQLHILQRLGIESEPNLFWIDTEQEPTTKGIDEVVFEIRGSSDLAPNLLVGIGGGSTLDTTKAVANVLANNGPAAALQGWDLVKKPSIPKVAIPTISGTGAESSRTAVLTNSQTGLKLGMNSKYSVFDLVIMDWGFTATVPRDQYFWTGMDAYIHSFESLEGLHRNAMSDSLSHEAIRLCRQVFSATNMLDDDSRQRLMIASYLGGCAIAGSMVGLVHPVSAALSSVLGTRHCVSNCIAMRSMGTMYPRWFDEFWTFCEQQAIEIPKLSLNLGNQELLNSLSRQLHAHTKPLENALGPNYREYLTDEKVAEIFAVL